MSGSNLSVEDEVLYNKDLAAFNLLYAKYSEKIYLNILKLVKNTETSQEILQATFVKIWEKRHLIEDGRPWSPYLYQIAKYAVYDYFRSQLIMRKANGQIVMDAQDAYSHIEEDYFFKEVQCMLDESIKKLPPQRRQVYTLCKIEGKSYLEVSEILSISAKTVSDHLLKANKFIRGELRNSELLLLLLFIFSSKK